ncbi:hypothetical protein FRC03_011066 [Tulasnella sp. 419]|nr:hypothetical protein FRC03_011066 [Tulasnella sp. 419]
MEQVAGYSSHISINTAFIVESYKGLRPDPTETTNSLLRILIKHRADNVTLSDEDLHPWNTDSSVVPVNSVFFASLSLSLTAAFGAVTAKQWLTEYSKTGSIKALHKQCRVRQAKFDGLETWRFHFLIELLPLILQLSLLIFLVGVVQFIWVLERRIAVMELVFSAAGLGLYLTTIIISMVFPASPFQTPLSRYSLQALTGISQISHQIGRKIGSLALTISLSFPSHRLRNWWEQRIHDGLDLLSTPMIDRIRQIWKHLFLGVDSCYARLLHPRHQPIARTSENWSKRDKLAAGTVVWLLEHSEHIDTTAVALDATLRLPGDLILSLINQKEGLRERLVMFHLNQISLASDASNPESADRMIIAQMALFHMFKLDGCLAYQPHLPLNCPIPIQVQIGGEGRHSNLKDSPSDSKLLAPVIVKWSQAVLSIPHCESLLRPRTLKIGLNVSKRNVATNSFVSSVIPAHLALEALTCSMLLGHTPPISTSSLEDNKWGDITRGIQNLLNDEPSWSTISYTALAVAAMHWKSPPEGGAGRWCYTTMDQEMDLEYSLKRSIYAPDKG